MSPIEQQLAKILEIEHAALDGARPLADYPGWNSLAALDFIVFVHSTCGVLLSADELKACRVVSDLIALVPAARA